MLCQYIIIGRDSEIAPTDGLLKVGCQLYKTGRFTTPLKTHQLALDKARIQFSQC